jgi:cell division protein FtsL
MTATQVQRAPRRAPAPAPAPPPPPPKARPPLRVVRPEETRRAVDRRRRARVLTALAVVFVVASLFGLVSSHVVLTQGQFRLEQLERKAADEQARFERLRLQVAQLESPERIVAAAQERLGMVPPPGVKYLSPVGPADGSAPARPADDSLAAGEDWTTVKRHLASRP